MGENSAELEAFVTLSTNDTYSLGCLVLAHSLRRVVTTRQLVVMITDGVSQSMRDHLSTVYDLVVKVNVLDSADPANLNLLGRPDLSVTFTKLHCWRLTQFTKCVFLDADILVLHNIDELFDREELSAAPDAGWPDCFNSGVFVYRPSEATYSSLLALAMSHGSFDGGDQGLLNLYFNTWATEDISKHLPFTYNVVSQAFYSYLPAFKQFQHKIKIVHFIGAVKPWHHPFSMSTGKVTALSETGHNQQFLQVWWDIFMSRVHANLDTNLSESLTKSCPVDVGRENQTGLVGDLANMQMTDDSDSAGRGDRERRMQWEHGQADYLGVDRFDNIRARLDAKINEGSGIDLSTNNASK